MKKVIEKIFLILITAMLFCPKVYAETDNIAFLTKIGFFEKKVKKVKKLQHPTLDIKKTMLTHLKYSNEYDIEGLKTLYAPSFVNSDGIGGEIYFGLIEKTWESYPNIKYDIKINNINILGDIAIVQMDEHAIASTYEKSDIVQELGSLESHSSTAYYLKKIQGEWKITSDHILYERTYLKYGEAKEIDFKIESPSEISAGEEYTAALEIKLPENTFVIASIGKERITHPQSSAKEIFRKYPSEGPLERMFNANEDNLNEYTVASFGLTRIEVQEEKALKLRVTGLGFAMSRVNVIPLNKFIKEEETIDIKEQPDIAKSESDNLDIEKKKSEAGQIKESVKDEQDK